jgi:hypothetical protein
MSPWGPCWNRYNIHRLVGLGPKPYDGLSFVRMKLPRWMEHVEHAYLLELSPEQHKRPIFAVNQEMKKLSKAKSSLYNHYTVSPPPTGTCLELQKCFASLVHARYDHITQKKEIYAVATFLFVESTHYRIFQQYYTMERSNYTMERS